MRRAVTDPLLVVDVDRARAGLVTGLPTSPLPDEPVVVVGVGRSGAPPPADLVADVDVLLRAAPASTVVPGSGAHQLAVPAPGMSPDPLVAGGPGMSPEPLVAGPGVSPDPLVVAGPGVGPRRRAAVDPWVAADPWVAVDPWVTVPDLDEATERLRGAVAASPLAAGVLVELLRHRPGRSVEEDLLAESLAYSTLQAGPEHARWLAGRRPVAHRSGEGPPVRLARRGGELAVTLARPQVRNAYDAATRDALCEALTVAVLDPSVTRVVLAGAGTDFCSGGDLAEFGTVPDPVTGHRIRTRRSVARLLHQVGDRVTVHVQGACVGAGVELAALAGHVVAAPDARFRLPELAMGLVPGSGGTASLPRRMGRHRTAWLALTGAWLGATDALAWGLVDEVVGAGGEG